VWSGRPRPRARDNPRLARTIEASSVPVPRFRACWNVGYNATVWQRFHILSRVQVFVVSALCAVVLAIAVALASIPTDGTSMQRFLGPSREFDPLINFGLALVSVLPVFLGYYHLGRLGVLLGFGIAAVVCFATGICAWFVFAFKPGGPSAVVEAGTYIGVCVLFSILLFAVHMKASNSRTIQNAQRLLHLLPRADTSVG
jgi:hypothetical protein